MAKAAPAPAISRIIEGRLPSSGRMFKITIYVNNSIQIEREGLPTLNESDWFPQRFLIGLIEPGAVRDMSCIV